MTDLQFKSRLKQIICGLEDAKRGKQGTNGSENRRAS